MLWISLCLTAIKRCRGSVNLHLSENCSYIYIYMFTYLFTIYLLITGSHSCFPPDQANRGCLPGIFHLKWFPDSPHSGSWGVRSRRPGKGLTSQQQHRSMLPPHSDCLVLLGNALIFLLLSGAAKEQHQACFCHEGPEEETDCQQRSTWTRSERTQHPDGDPLSVHHQVSLTQQLFNSLCPVDRIKTTHLPFFCVHIYYRLQKTFRDAEHLFFLTEACLGGDLSHLLKDKWVSSTGQLIYFWSDPLFRQSLSQQTLKHEKAVLSSICLFFLLILS